MKERKAFQTTKMRYLDKLLFSSLKKKNSQTILSRYTLTTHNN